MRRQKREKGKTNKEADNRMTRYEKCIASLKKDNTSVRLSIKSADQVMCISLEKMLRRTGKTQKDKYNDS